MYDEYMEFAPMMMGGPQFQMQQDLQLQHQLRQHDEMRRNHMMIRDRIDRDENEDGIFGKLRDDPDFREKHPRLARLYDKRLAKSDDMETEGVIYDDYLDKLLEEAYLEGYYDSMDDYDDYYIERKSTIHPAYHSELLNPNKEVWYSKIYPHEEKIFNKLKDKYKDKDTFNKYDNAYYKLVRNKLHAYSNRETKDNDYVRNKGIYNPGSISDAQLHRRPLDMNKYIAKSEKGKANLEKYNRRNESTIKTRAS